MTLDPGVIIAQNKDEEQEDKRTVLQKVLDALEKPTLQYVWKGKRTIKNKKGEVKPSPLGRQKRGIFLATIKEDKVVIGFSLCNLKLDRFNYVKGSPVPDFGVYVAIERAEKWKDLEASYVGPANLEGGKGHVAIPHSLVESLASFIEKCKGYKRYENKSFPPWVDGLELFRSEKQEKTA